MEIQLNIENIPKQATQVVEIAKELFKNQLIGIYLYGSAILGGLHPNSDVDILIISNQRMSEEIRNELTKRFMTISGKVGCTSKRPLEVTVINQNDIAPWQFPPNCEYMYGEWLREQMEAGEIPQPCFDPDLVILLWQARNHSLPLEGPDVKNLIEPIRLKDIHRAIHCSMPGLIASAKGDERNVILTLARMWFTISTGKICPKDMAAEWAGSKLPENLAPLLETARKAYLGECSDNWLGLESETDALITFMSNAIGNMLDNMGIS